MSIIHIASSPIRFRSPRIFPSLLPSDLCPILAMDSTWGRRRSGLILLIIAVVSPSCTLSFPQNDYLHCESVVSDWAEISLETEGHEDKSILKDMLFFLHVPRTGGRSYYFCFLRNLYKKDQLCPRSYDKLRFNPSNSKCKLIVTHDDYSFMSKLPKERTSVVTILRNPVDRVFSTYEFAMEVAARFLVHPNLTSAVQMSIRIRPKARIVSTLDIWPWKYLVPWMREDLFARRDARKQKIPLITGNGNPYDMEEVVMPLQDFINEPIAHEIVHNGATFQVAGLTNNSGLLESHEVRHCVSKHPVLGHYVLEVAKRRLDNMLYVGLTEDHKQSATLFANMVGAQVLSQLESDALEEQKSTTESGTSASHGENDDSNQLQSSVNEESANNVSLPENLLLMNETMLPEKMTVQKLMDSYEKCTVNLRKTQAQRKTVSLKTVAPANFSKGARNMVPQSVIEQILLLNNLDVELYEHAKQIFLQQQRRLDESLLTVNQSKNLLHYWMLGWGSNFGFRGTCAWNNLMISASLIIMLSVFWYAAVFMRRRTSKIKV